MGAEEGRGRAFRTGGVLTLAGAHFVHDTYTALLAPLLPLLIPNLGLSLALAGSLVVFMQLPSLANPLLGAAVDRGKLARPLVIVTPAVTAVSMCLVGLAPSYWLVAATLLIAGTSVAAIHVAAPVLVAQSAGDRLGRGTSFFMVGGELARTVGPLVAVAGVAAFGLEGLWRLAPVGVAASLVLWWRLGRASSSAPRRRRRQGLLETYRRMGKVLAGVFGILLARAFMVAATTAFLPVLLHGEGSSLLVAGLSLSVFELAGAAGALAAGTASDWLGRRWVLLVATALSPLLMVLFLLAEGWMIFPALLGLGVVTLATTPVLLAVVLENARGSRATASGAYMMMSFAIRSLVVPLVGVVGDELGLRTAFWICAALATAGVPFVALIPRRRGAEG